MPVNDTHDPERCSWLSSANEPDSDFPLQNLPHGVFSHGGGPPRGGVAIGDRVLDLSAWVQRGFASGSIGDIARAAAANQLNAFVAMGNEAAAALRRELFEFLGNERYRGAGESMLVPMAEARLHLPLTIGSFTDFMTSVQHVSAARLSRPARAVSENFLHLPVAYHGRSTSITVDGVGFPRPVGQFKDAKGRVVFEPTRQLDFELEFGAIVGRGNDLGSRVSIDQSPQHLFGYVLVNDWSARDIQLWESRLGPFLGKSFRTTVSPWLVTSEALAPFRIPAPTRSADQPQVLPYLQSARHLEGGGMSVSFRATHSTERMRSMALQPFEIVHTRLDYCIWTFEQMLTHHTSNGCNLLPGDLLSSGTISGPQETEAACLFERTAGALPLELPSGESRLWLEDGDELAITGRAERAGFRSIGFGACGARVLPAR